MSRTSPAGEAAEPPCPPGETACPPNETALRQLAGRWQAFMDAQSRDQDPSTLARGSRFSSFPGPPSAGRGQRAGWRRGRHGQRDEGGGEPVRRQHEFDAAGSDGAEGHAGGAGGGGSWTRTRAVPLDRADAPGAVVQRAGQDDGDGRAARPRRRWPAARPRPGRCRWRAAGVAGCRESWRPPVMVADVPPGITVTPGPHAASPGVPVRTGRLVCFCRIAQELTVTLPGRRYELAGRLMAQAITDARAGSSVTGSREQPEEIPGRRRMGKASGQVGSGRKTVPTGVSRRWRAGSRPSG
jgi:hypothetical protein